MRSLSPSHQQRDATFGLIGVEVNLNAHTFLAFKVTDVHKIGNVEQVFDDHIAGQETNKETTTQAATHVRATGSSGNKEKSVRPKIAENRIR